MSREKERSSRRERFLPYAHERFGLTCRLERAEVDDEVVEPDQERHLVAMDGRPWERLTLRGVVQVPAETLAKVFPPEEQAAPPARVLVVVRSAITRLRRCVVASEAPAPSGPVPFSLTLRRQDVEGSVELHPMLVRAAPADPPVAGFAARRGTRLAASRSWAVRVDRLREPEGRFLDTRYRRFSEDEELRAHADTLFWFHVSEAPTLWINADHEKIQRVLDDRGTRGPRARLREATFDLIAQSVWTQLFVQAAIDLRRSDELVYEWEDAVLRELLPALIKGERTHAARVAALRQRLEREELLEVLGQLASVLQRRNNLVAHLTKLVEEVESRS